MGEQYSDLETEVSEHDTNHLPILDPTLSRSYVSGEVGSKAPDYGLLFGAQDGHGESLTRRDGIRPRHDSRGMYKVPSTPRPNRKSIL